VPANVRRQEKPKGETIGPKKMAAAVAIATGDTTRATAEKVQVDERTIYRWKKEDGFITLVRDIRQALFTAGVGRLAAGLEKAADTLVRNLTSGRANVEVQAARAIFDLALNGHSVVELGDRVAELEKIHGEREKSSGFSS
jgi:hypothetical protein